MKILELVPLLGALQGITLALVIVSLPSKNKRANWTLAAFVAAESVRLFVVAFTFSEEAPRQVPFYHLLHLGYAFGPLLYFYVRSLVSPDFRYSLGSLLHFLPLVMATYILGASEWVFSAEDFSYNSYREVPRALEVKIALSTIPVFISLFIYSLLSLRYLRDHTRNIKSYFSSLESINLKWLQFIVYLCLATALVSASTELVRAVLPVSLGPRVVFSVFLSVFMIYYMGIMGLRQPVIFNQSDEGTVDGEEQVVAEPEPESEPEPAPEQTPAAPAPQEKYQKSGLSADDVAALWQKLQAHMREQQPHLDSELKLAGLARQLHTRPNYLSQVINSCAEQNFFDFINGYRIAEAERRLAAPDFSDQSITAIAESVGFCSQNSFNSRFKKATGTTPRAFRKANLPA